MGNGTRIPPAIVLGIVTGAVILGLVGRAAMAGVALAGGRELNLSLRGVIEVVLVGALMGGIGGLLDPPVRRLLPAGRFARGFALGGVLFVISILAMLVGGGLVAREILAATLVVSGIVYVIYGVTLETLIARQGD